MILPQIIFQKPNIVLGAFRLQYFMVQKETSTQQSPMFLQKEAYQHGCLAFANFTQLAGLLTSVTGSQLHFANCL